jgi:hypothetical protein
MSRAMLGVDLERAEDEDEIEIDEEVADVAY